MQLPAYDDSLPSVQLTCEGSEVQEHSNNHQGIRLPEE